MSRFGGRKRSTGTPPARQAVRDRLAGLVETPDDVYVPSLGQIDSATLPAYLKPDTPPSSLGEGLLAETDLSSRLNDVTALALERAYDILEKPVDPDSDYYPEELRAQTSTIKTALTTQVRVDETKLRMKVAETLPKLLAILKEEEARLGIEN